MKHTPGPWMLWTETGFEVYPSPKGMRIAAVRTEADARLIAAAPRMHDLLCRLRDTVEALDGTSVENEKIVDEYRKLIAEI